MDFYCRGEAAFPPAEGALATRSLGPSVTFPSASMDLPPIAPPTVLDTGVSRARRSRRLSRAVKHVRPHFARPFAHAASRHSRGRSDLYARRERGSDGADGDTHDPPTQALSVQTSATRTPSPTWTRRTTMSVFWTCSRARSTRRPRRLRLPSRRTSTTAGCPWPQTLFNSSRRYTPTSLLATAASAVPPAPAEPPAPTPVVPSRSSCAKNGVHIRAKAGSPAVRLSLQCAWEHSGGEGVGAYARMLAVFCPQCGDCARWMIDIATCTNSVLMA
jgi:hypothetical protein